ncbi:hypothetical protein D3C72_2121620 [compost metagenome]
MGPVAAIPEATSYILREDTNPVDSVRLRGLESSLLHLATLEPVHLHNAVLPDLQIRTGVSPSSLMGRPAQLLYFQNFSYH